LPVVGYTDRTVFWFPRLTIGALAQTQFQRNLWRFFGIAPNAVNPAGPVEAVGGNYRNVFTPMSSTVHVALDPAESAAGAIVWDWTRMELAGIAAAGPAPAVTIQTGQDEAYFLGVTPRIVYPQFVALSGGLLGRVVDAGDNRLAVAVYRTRPGRPVTVAVYLGPLRPAGASISGGTLESAGFDPSGQVYLVTSWPYGDKLTVTVATHERRVYLPLVVRGT
jgi:hypothetical protein